MLVPAGQPLRDACKKESTDAINMYKWSGAFCGGIGEETHGAQESLRQERVPTAFTLGDARLRHRSNRADDECRRQADESAIGYDLQGACQGVD